MDAELLLADMEFNDDDSPENVKLKENVIELYTARLDERIRRKKFGVTNKNYKLLKIQELGIFKGKNLLLKEDFLT